MTVMTEEAERLNSQLHPPFPTAFFLHKMHTEVFKDQKKTCKEVSSSASHSLARFRAGKRPPVLSVITHRLCAGVKIKLPSKKLKTLHPADSHGCQRHSAPVGRLGSCGFHCP